MHGKLIVSALFGAATASPIVMRAGAWTPLPGTVATCAEQEKYMSLVIGPEDAKSILVESCAAFMPACAYPTKNELPEGTFCSATDVYTLNEPKNVTLPVLVEQDGNKLSGWAVNCKFLRINVLDTRNNMLTAIAQSSLSQRSRTSPTSRMMCSGPPATARATSTRLFRTPTPMDATSRVWVLALAT